MSQTNRKWEVHKLGGTSVGDAGCYLRVPQVVGLDKENKDGMCVSKAYETDHHL